MSVISNNQLAGAAGQGGSDAYEIQRSLRFNSADTSYLSKTFATSGNRRTFTVSFWIKKPVNDAAANFYRIIGSEPGCHFYLYEDNLFWDISNGGYALGTRWTNAKFRDPSAWYHVVGALDTTNGTADNRMRLWINGVEPTSWRSKTNPSQNQETGWCKNIEHTIGYRTANQGSQGGALNALLADVHFIDGQAKTASDFGEFDSNNVWQPKEYDGTYGTNGFHLGFSDNSSDSALGYDAAVTAPTLNPDGGFEAITYTGNGSTNSVTGLSFQPDLVWIKNRTDSASHMLFDSVRGVKKVIYSNATTQEQSANISLTSYDPNGFTVGSANEVNGNNDNMIAWCWKAGGSASSNSNGSITSQVSANTDYGFSVVTWTGSGSNATIGHGLSSAPKFILCKFTGSTSNWSVYHSAIGNTKRLVLNSTDSASTSSTYWQNTSPTSSVFSVGSDINDSTSIVAYCWSEVSGFSKFGSYSGTGNAVTVTTGFKPRYILVKSTSSGRDWLVWDTARGPSGGALQPNTSGTAYSDSTYNGISFNSDGFTIMTGGSTPNMSASGETYIYAAFADRPGNNFDVNNLVADTHVDGSLGMDAVTYTGNGSSSRSITDLNFQPDFVWIKQRNGTYSHNLYDSVRGATKLLNSNANGAEETFTNGLTAFNSNGFSLGNYAAVNGNNQTFVAWCWKAGGSASANSNGDIQTQVSVNSTYGFSVSTWTSPSSADTNGWTLGHGLPSAPKFMLVKNRSSAGNWTVYHASLGNTKALYLNDSGTGQTNQSLWNNTDPTSTVWSAGSTGWYGTSNNFVTYAWCEIDGFSKFGSYTGNGNSTGPVVNVGFKPRYVIVRRTDAGNNWTILDSARSLNNDLKANTSEAEASAPFIFSDTGFQPNNTYASTNASGGTYIYAAFADKPDQSVIDSLIDTPTDVENDSGNNGGNYCTLNPLDSTLGTRLSDGNLKAVGNNNWAQGHTRGTFGLTSGKWYWEVTKIAGGAYAQIGFCNKAFNFSTVYGSLPADSWTLAFHNGTEILRPAGGGANYFSGSAMAVGDVLGIALDMDNKTAIFYKNGTAGASISLSSTKTSSTDNIDEIFPLVGVYSLTAAFNGGQRPFAYTPPTGYKSLCTTNLPDPTIEDGSTAFDVALWNGTGSSQTISLDFNPDMIWSKTRNHAVDHKLVDSVRGFTKQVEPNQTIAEYTNSTGVTGTSSSGFTIGSSNDWNNSSSRTYVGWAWDAGSSNATNNNGSIQSTVRANQSAGFSIVTGSGNSGTVGHGLNAKPDLVIVKQRNGAVGWAVAHSALGTMKDNIIYLNGTNANTNSSNFWGSANFDSSVFPISSNILTSGATFVAYCFTAVEGYSAFGSYTGNGSADGPFVYTGFRSRWVMIKKTNAAGNWGIYDTSRDPENVQELTLAADGSAAESTDANKIDITSTGFKVRASNANVNTSGSTYIYAAFAEHPFKSARAR